MIAVLGGGITGLLIGWELQRLGGDFVVLEATERAGGVIRSGEVEGRVVEWGPQRMRMTPVVQHLISALALDQEVVTAPGDLDLWVFRAGTLRRIPFSTRAFLRSDIVSVQAKLGLLLEPLTRGPDAAESVAAFFRRKVGAEVYETIVGPLFGGLYASDPADMLVGISLVDFLRRTGVERSLVMAIIRGGGRVSPPPPCSFRGGMQVLPDALAVSLGERLRLSCPVRRVARAGAGWRIEVGGDGDYVEAEAVVVTTPAPATAELLREVAPQAAASIAELRYNPLAIVHLDAETDLHGLGFQVAFTEPDLLLRGVTYNDSMFAREHLYTAFLGGARHPEVVRLSKDDLATTAVSEFRRTTGHDARPLSVEHTQMPAWDRSWRAVAGLTLPSGLHIASNWWSRAGLPGRFAEAKQVSKALVSESRRR